MTQVSYSSTVQSIGINIGVCVYVPMPTHCIITCFGLCARQIDGIECGLFSIHALLGQTTLRVGRVFV